VTKRPAALIAGTLVGFTLMRYVRGNRGVMLFECGGKDVAAVSLVEATSKWRRSFPDEPSRE